MYWTQTNEASGLDTTNLSNSSTESGVPCSPSSILCSLAAACSSSTRFLRFASALLTCDFSASSDASSSSSSSSDQIEDLFQDGAEMHVAEKSQPGSLASFFPSTTSFRPSSDFFLSFF